MGFNDKVWPDLDLGRRSNWEGVCAMERSYLKLGKVGVDQILKRYLEYFSSHVYLKT